MDSEMAKRVISRARRIGSGHSHNQPPDLLEHRTLGPDFAYFHLRAMICRCLLGMRAELNQFGELGFLDYNDQSRFTAGPLLVLND
jgi:hypothetical protein